MFNLKLWVVYLWISQYSCIIRRIDLLGSILAALSGLFNNQHKVTIIDHIIPCLMQQGKYGITLPQHKKCVELLLIEEIMHRDWWELHSIVYDRFEPSQFVQDF